MKACIQWGHPALTKRQADLVQAMRSNLKAKKAAREEPQEGSAELLECLRATLERMGREKVSFTKSLRESANEQYRGVEFEGFALRTPLLC